jgi:hypothetical protein
VFLVEMPAARANLQRRDGVVELVDLSRLLVKLIVWRIASKRLTCPDLAVSFGLLRPRSRSWESAPELNALMIILPRPVP